MPKKIIILESDAGSVRVAFWLDVPLARRPYYADLNATSAYKDASGAELALLQSGAVTEVVTTYGVNAISNVAAAKAFLESELTIQQNKVDAHNPWSRYGIFYDGSTWTGGGIS